VGARALFLHVGCRKSGTSALQRGLRDSAEALAGHGLAQPLRQRTAVQHRLVEPVRRSLAGAGTVPPRLQRLVDQVRTSPVPRHLVSLEALAEWGTDATGLVLDACAGLDVHVVITARPWALTIPSEWQQRVKSRYTGGYLEWAAAVRDPSRSDLAAEAHGFRLRQDVADVARRWGAGSGRVRTHVVLVPPVPDPAGLLEPFCDVIGVDPGLVTLPDLVINPSLSHPDAELLRRVNLALGDRLADPGAYATSVRRAIVQRVMMDQSGDRIRLPREHEAWATEQGERQLSELRELGCEIVGDEAAYLRPRLPGTDVETPTGDELAAAAADVLAALAVGHDWDLRQARAEEEARARDEAGRQAGHG